jgi:hypothetical protein
MRKPGESAQLSFPALVARGFNRAVSAVHTAWHFRVQEEHITTAE